LRDGLIHPAARFDLRELLSLDDPGIFFIFVFARNVCMNVQTKSARLMRDTLARDANKDGIFSEIICLLRVRD
jgi:hypothetical protein